MNEEREPLLKEVDRRDVDVDVDVDPNLPSPPVGLDSTTVPGFPHIIVPKRKVVIEPVLFMYCLVMIGSVPVVEQYLYARFMEQYPILHTNETGDINKTTGCPINVNTSDPVYIATEEVQSKTTQWQMYLQATSSIVNIFTTLIYGAYSDAAGRRIVLLLTSGAMAIKFVLNCFVIFFNLPVYCFLIGQFIDGLGGGFAAIMMSVFAYIADITTPEKRGMRIAIAEACLTMALAISQVSLGFFIKAEGFFYPYLSLTLISLLNLVYLSFFVPETVATKTRKFSVTASLKETLKTYVVKENGRHIKVAVLVVAILLFSFPLTTKFSLQILFAMNIPLCWSSVEIGIYMAITAFTLQIGGLGSLKCFKMCRMPEIWIAVVGCLSWIASNLVNAWADTLALMLIVCAAGLFLMAGVPMYRTIISRLVEKDEQGKVFSGIACAEAIGSFLSSIVMNTIYKETLGFMRGFVFIVGAMFAFSAMVVTMIYICYEKATGKKGGRFHMIN